MIEGGSNAAFFVFRCNLNEMDGEKNATPRMGYIRIETERAGRHL